MRIYSFVTLWVLAVAWLAVLSPFTAGAGPVPKVGDLAPLIEGKDQDGKTWKLADVFGKKVVLLNFYPKDDTPGYGGRENWTGS
jgi:peroxiredoxin Q/BCP